LITVDLNEAVQTQECLYNLDFKTKEFQSSFAMALKGLKNLNIIKTPGL
jgi:hypothetical protein